MFSCVSPVVFLDTQPSPLCVVIAFLNARTSQRQNELEDEGFD